MIEGGTRDQRVFLSLLPAGRRERGFALAAGAVSLLVFLAMVPFAQVQLARLDAFIPVYQSALIITDLLTAALLYGQFSILRSRGLLLLASGYVFTAAMVVVHTLSFPGLFAPTGLLGAGPQTTAWLYMFWHAGFPLMVIGYAVSMPIGYVADSDRAGGSASRPILVSIVAAIAAVVGLAALATAGQGLLPPIMQGNRYTPAMVVVVSGVWLLSVAAIPMLWRRRPHSVLDLWLMVSMCAWVCDIGLSAVFNAGRFDLGFYAGRIFGLLAASFVLLVMLLETRALYVRLARSLSEERRIAEQRAGDLARMNAQLEERVAERTRQLEAETAERERTQEALREAQKLEAIGRMAGGIAHDFNNLLTVVQGNAEYLQDRVIAVREQQAAQAIERAAERGARLIRQILVFSRRQALKREVLDLRARAGEMSELLTRSLRGDIRLVLDLPDDLWPIECDIGELELALMNLCVNARDAMPDGGLVRLEGRNRTLAKDLAAASELTGPFVALSIVDSGSGIAPEDLRRVFEPFFTTKEVGKGSGLGLAQVYGLAQQSGGIATIDSTVGQGTTVTMYLPRAKAPPLAVLGEAKAAAARGKGSVLVVEDDEDVAQVSVTMLSMLGYEAHLVRDARTALSLLLGGQRFDLLFSDIVMPGGMSGLDLARRVRQHFPWLPILLASGYHRPAAEVDREGFNLIAKPYRADALSDAIQQCLAQAGRGTRTA
jgi:signal transduction histidine kinase/ActR/RegA family two-component response regulator